MEQRRLNLVCLSLVTLLLVATGLAATTRQVATLEDLSVNSEVDGDLFVLAGTIRLGAAAHVHGHAVAVLGSIEMAPGARVDGRTIAISSLTNFTLEPVAGSLAPGLRLAISLLSAGGWMLVTTLLALLFPGRLRHGTWVLPRLSWRVLLIGLLSYVTLIAALVAVLGLGPGLGVPLSVSLGLVFLGTRALGLAVLSASLGGWVIQRLLHRQLPLTVPVLVGVTMLLVLRFVPVIGGQVWMLISLASVGTGVFALALAPEAWSEAPSVARVARKP